jgi:hypothetical protein
MFVFTNEVMRQSVKNFPYFLHRSADQGTDNRYMFVKENLSLSPFKEMLTKTGIMFTKEV